MKPRARLSASSSRSPSPSRNASTPETSRLAELHRYEILDTEPERAFDHVARLAAHRFDAPIALVSLVDEERQWFKACVGVSIRETGVDLSFCVHAIETPDVLVVPDATQDPRFEDNPLVTDDPGIRFYAGAPLQTPGGHLLGTLCVLDTEPREDVDPKALKHLEWLSRIVVDEMELRREVKAHRRTTATLRQSRDVAERARQDAERARREAEEARREAEEAREEAEEMNRLKTAFLANMSHEIRTPLTTILGFTDVLRELDLSDEAQRFSGFISKSSKRLLNTLSAVLDLAQLEAHTKTLHPGLVDVAGTVRLTVDRYRDAACSNDLELDVSVPETPITMRVDAQALDQVLKHLMDNALKFTEAGGRVTVTLEEDGEDVVLTVDDTGMGMTEAFARHAFRAFYQESEGHERGHEGAGLGLSIAKKYVDLMNGEVDLQSEPESGTTVTVRLPREPSRRDE